jgi:heme-degrading monooxygenase HmoA
MVITILEAHVAADKSEALEKAYKEGIRELEPGILQTFLLHGVADASLWRIITVWRSREALDAMRQSGQTPRGVLMFRTAEAEPTLSISNVAAHAVAAA